MQLVLPDFGAVLLIAASAADVGLLADRLFAREDVVDATDHGRIEQRLRARELVVIRALSSDRAARDGVVEVAARCFAGVVAIVLGAPLASGKKVSPTARGCQTAGVSVGQLRCELADLAGAGFRDVHLVPRAALARARLVPTPLACDRRELAGPFDIIGDVHGCRDELVALLDRLGYGVSIKGKGARRRATVTAPPGRRAIFVGDLVDRGPAAPDVLRIVMGMVADGSGLAVLGNHDSKFMRWLQGRNVALNHGLEKTVAQMRQEPDGLRGDVRQFLEALPYQLWLDGGRLLVVHAGVRADMIGRQGAGVRDFCVFGDRSGKKDAQGLPERYHWALDYGDETAVIYGHTPVARADWVNATLCIDTGCVFGGSLTAFRWPEMEIVAVPAKRAYAKRLRAFGHPPPRPKAADGAGVET